MRLRAEATKKEREKREIREREERIKELEREKQHALRARESQQQSLEKLAIFGREMGDEELKMNLDILSDLMLHFSDRYKAYISSTEDYASSSFIPNIADVLVLLPEPLYTSVYNKDISGDQLWDAIVPLLPSLISTYKKNIQDKCMHALLSSRGSVKVPQLMEIGRDPAVVFSMAWAFFTCVSMQCSYVGSYAAMCSLEHKDDAWPKTGPEPRPKYFHLVNFVKSPLALMDVACMLLKNLNIPLNTLMEELNNLGSAFMCLRCKKSTATMMTWKELVKCSVFCCAPPS